MAITNVTTQNFKEEIVNETKPIIVDFWAPWCGPCQMMGPVFESLSNDKTMQHLKFVKINTQDQPEIANLFQIRGIPTLVALHNKKEVNRMSGFAPAEILKPKINEMFARIL